MPSSDRVINSMMLMSLPLIILWWCIAPVNPAALLFAATLSPFAAIQETKQQLRTWRTPIARQACWFLSSLWALFLQLSLTIVFFFALLSRK